ncbi:VOC family protein [Sphingomonas swuensis]
MIFINLPVKDVARSTAFYETLGFTKDPKFSNEQASMMAWSDEIKVMLLAHPFYSTFTSKPVADAHATSQVLLCVSANSRAGVDAMVATAEAAGGLPDPGPTQEMGEMMYGRSFEDPDGHHWEVGWMNLDAMAEVPHQPIVEEA